MATRNPDGSELIVASRYMTLVDLRNHTRTYHGVSSRSLAVRRSELIENHDVLHEMSNQVIRHTHKPVKSRNVPVTATAPTMTVEQIQQAVAGIWADAMDKYGEDWCAKSQVYIQQQLAGIGVKVDAPANGYISVAIHVSGMTSNDDLTDEDQDKVAAILEPLVKGLVFDLSNRTLTVAPYKGHLVDPDYPDVDYL